MRSLITSRGVRILGGVLVDDTGTGPLVRAPPLLLARPPPRSDICAFSSANSGVKGCGLRMASSRVKRMAARVRLEMRRAGWVGG